jgi:hypothetical protein
MEKQVHLPAQSNDIIDIRLADFTGTGTTYTNNTGRRVLILSYRENLVCDGAGAVRRIKFIRNRTGLPFIDFFCSSIDIPIGFDGELTMRHEVESFVSVDLVQDKIPLGAFVEPDESLTIFFVNGGAGDTHEVATLVLEML